MKIKRGEGKVYLKCETCEIQFSCYKSEIEKAKKKGVRRAFCSRTCYGKFSSKHQSGEGNHQWKKELKECVFCKKLFKPYNYLKARFCSQRCLWDYDHFKNSFETICGICGKKIRKVNWHKRTKILSCSRACANKLHSQRMSGEGNSAWRGGIGKLPWGWEFNKKLKNEIKKRDNFTCQLCGETERLLAVHHVDYNKHNNVSENLVALCEICHCKTNYNREMWKKLLLNKSKNFPLRQQQFSI